MFDVGLSKSKCLQGNLIKNVKPRKVLISVNFSIDSIKQENVQFNFAEKPQIKGLKKQENANPNHT